MNFILKNNNKNLEHNRHIPKLSYCNNQIIENLSHNDIDHINNNFKRLLLENKNKINESYYWDIAKKNINEYEHILVYIRSYNLIPYFNPISRAYFKLSEILYDYNIVFKECLQNIKKSVHIAEAPGGFIEAFIDFSRKNYINNTEKHTITLKSSDQNQQVPSFKFSQSYIKHNNINIDYGLDGTGNIYKRENVLSFMKKIGPNSCSFITADGGFDFSENFNIQEENFNKMLISEIFTIIHIQKDRGCAIIKMFDIYNKDTQFILYILSNLYKDMYITKPLSSRPANSEKYIICANFIQKNLTKEIYNIIQVLFNNKENSHNNLDYENTNFQFDQQQFMLDITKFNYCYTQRQSNYINKTITEVDYVKKLSSKERHNYIKYKNKQHSINCKQWCASYISR